MILCFVFTLAGFAWKPDPFPPVTLFDEATVLLAMGTLALAFAALVQAVSGVETMNAKYKPNFELVWESSNAPNANPTCLPSGKSLHFRNLGPGAARLVRVQLHVYPNAKDADSHFNGSQPTGAGSTIQTKFLPTIPIDSPGVELIPEKLSPPPNQTEAVVEILGRSVFDQTSAIRVYRLRGVWDPLGRSDQSVDGAEPHASNSNWQITEWTTWQHWQAEDVPTPDSGAISSTRI